MPIRSVLQAMLLLAAATIADRAAATVDVFDPQPPARNSGIVLQGSTLLDSGFASLVRDTIVDEAGNPRVKNAIFLFQQCFGGGFLDDLNRVLPPELSYIAASAGRHDEVTFGLKSQRELVAQGVTPPPGYPLYSKDQWTAALLPGLNNPIVSVHDAVGAAIIGDPVGTFGGQALKENGQRITRPLAPDGTPVDDMFSLRDPDDKSFHGILIAGDATFDQYREDVMGMYDAIVKRWGDPRDNPDVTISVLFGNGMTDAAGNSLPPEWNAQAATPENFQMALDTIKPKLNTDEKFFVYVTDHGNSNGTISNLPRGPMMPGTRRNGTYDMSQGELQGYQLDMLNPPPGVRLYFDYVSIPGPDDRVSLFFNDEMIGTMAPQQGANSFMAPVPENLLGATNTVSIQNDTSQVISVTSAGFLGAPINVIPLDAKPPPLQFTLEDLFDDRKVNEEPLSLNIVAMGPDGVVHQNLPNVPHVTKTRGHTVAIQSQSTSAMATITTGTNAAMPGTLEINLTGAQPGDAALANVTYLLNDDGQDLSYPGGALLKVQLAQPPTGGGVQIAAIVGDADMMTHVIPLMPDDKVDLCYSAILDNSAPLDLEHIEVVRFGFIALAGSDAQIVIDAIRIGPVLPGDYNRNGIVDAADYVFWREYEGTQQEFDVWRANFGRTAAASAASAVPEPGGRTLLVLGAWIILRPRRRICPPRHGLSAVGSRVSARALLPIADSRQPIADSHLLSRSFAMQDSITFSGADQ